MGAFSDFLGNVFSKRTKGVGSVSIPSLDEYLFGDEETRICIDTYALFTAIEMLANLMANCEIKTYRRGKEYKGDLWARLNYRPNVNQTATEFWREFYEKLLYYGEVMVFETADEQMIIADGFNISDYEIKEKYFSDVYRGTFQSYKLYKMSEVLYIRYPNENARALRLGLLARYEKLISAASESYVSGSGNKVLLSIPGAAQGAPGFMENYNDLMDNRFKSFFKSKNAVIPLWNGMQASFASSSAASRRDVDDITKLVNDAMARAAQAYKLSPALLTGEIAGIKEALNFTLTVALDPLANAISEQLTVKFCNPWEITEQTYIAADTSNIKHIDIFDIATNVDKLISSGFASPDEARVFAGLQATGLESMREHYFTKNYALIDDIFTNSEGGETNEE